MLISLTSYLTSDTFVQVYLCGSGRSGRLFLMLPYEASNLVRLQVFEEFDVDAPFLKHFHPNRRKQSEN